MRRTTRQAAAKPAVATVEAVAEEVKPTAKTTATRGRKRSVNTATAVDSPSEIESTTEVAPIVKRQRKSAVSPSLAASNDVSSSATSSTASSASLPSLLILIQHCVS